MTYIERLNEFHQWLESNTLPGNAQLLYFRLLNVFNRAGWPEHVQVDTRRLTTLAECEKDAAYRARDRLRDAGFISYRKGKKGAPTTYFLSDKTPESESETAPESESETASESETIITSESDTINATHIKTKTKTKNISPLTPRGAEGVKKHRFVPPTVAEVRDYCLERQNGIDAEEFVSFYESKGWMVGKNKMKNWKSAVITWEKQRNKATEGTLFQSRTPAKRGRLVRNDNGEEVVVFG